MRVLLVEDTRVLQTIQKKMLTTLGAAVEIAGDGSEAVAMFTKALDGISEVHADGVALPYDVIFMDCQVSFFSCAVQQQHSSMMVLTFLTIVSCLFQMPVMDGYEATKRIREEESRHGIHTPIIALTAHSGEEGLQETIQAGMDLHLTKPIQRKKIVEAVHQVCKGDKN
jgi:CheY-like chemotaxis protein